ncbi:hypothetical protein [Desulfosediminicola sp.]|uniref:hypothetical protein n=1 Tax=Desulfosediminicola sp. TaxID=2886825 RepID=UPI003AF23D39
MRFLTVLFCVVCTLFLVACGDESVKLDNVVLVKSLDNTQTVSIYLGTDQDYLELSLKADQIKSGNKIKTENASLSDGLTATATWSGSTYFSSSKHPTFTSCTIESIDAGNKKALLKIAAKLVEPRSEKFWEAKEQSIEITGKHFDELTRLATL